MYVQIFAFSRDRQNQRLHRSANCSETSSPLHMSWHSYFASCASTWLSCATKRDAICKRKRELAKRREQPACPETSHLVRLGSYTWSASSPSKRRRCAALRRSDRPSVATDRTSSMRNDHPRPLKRRQEQQQQVRCYRFMHPMSDLSPESVTTSMPGATNRVEFEKKYLAGSLCEADIKGRFSID